MRRLPGQAARILLRLLHWGAEAAMAIVVIASVAAAVLGWRLAQGPLNLPWLTDRIEARVNAEDSATHLSIGGVALAWEGLTEGVDRPLDLRLRALTITDSNGDRLISVPRAAVSLSVFGLLLGRIQPRAIEIDDASVKAFRSVNGDISLDLRAPPDAADKADTPGAADEPGIRLAALLDEFGKPIGDDFGPQRGIVSQLRRVRIMNASIVLIDHQMETTWRAPHAEIDLIRREAGGMEGHASLNVALGDQTAKLTVEAALAQGGKGTEIRAAMTPLAPAALARTVTALAPLAALDAPLGATATVDLGPTLALQQARMTLQAGAGTVHIGSASIALVSGTVVAVGGPGAIALEQAKLSVRGHDGGDVTVLSATGNLQRDANRIHARLALQLDQVAFADLPKLWPQGMGGVTRDWITFNITGGTARNGNVQLEMDARPDFSDARLSGASGTLDGDGVTVYWLRPLQPIVDGVAQLRILDPDSVEIAISSGRERRGGAKDDGGGLAVDGKLTITGVQQRQQHMTIDSNLTGALGDALAVLGAPPLNLLSKAPIDLNNVSGQLAAHLSIAMPLTDPPQPDAMVVNASAHLDTVRVGDIVAGRGMTQGKIDLKADRNGVTLTGQGVLGALPATFDASLDLRDGPDTQVVQTVNLAGQATPAQLNKAGVNPGGIFVGGSAAATVKLQQRRDGRADVAVTADFAQAEMRLEDAGWSKPAGAPGQGDAIFHLDRGRLVGIDEIKLSGANLSVEGHATVGDGDASTVQFDRLTLGRTSAKGSIRFPGAAGGPVVAVVSGPTLDLSHRLSYHAPGAEADEAGHSSADTGGQSWQVDARFDRTLMANGQSFDGLTMHAETDGRRITRLRFDAHAGSGTPILLEIGPAAGGRRLTAHAADAGRLMKALDVMETMEGGRLSINGTFDDRAADHPLSGTAEIEGFRIRDAPALARVLQAMTLYGLVNAVGGQGLGFDKLIAPFRLDRSVLELSEARAFNSSLGLTAQGSINLAEDYADLNGTVVPAYFFNSLLGRVPLLGKLFSPQTGGGLFAASYTVHGPLRDPKVSVNPLSALTPGFLRGLFGNF